MGLRDLSLGLKQMLNLLCVYLSVAFGFLALLWGFCTSQDWHFGLGSRGFLTSTAFYNLLVLFCLLFLGFKVQRLNLRWKEISGLLRQFRKIPVNLGTGFYSNSVICAACDRKVQSCNGTLCHNSRGDEEFVMERVCSCGCRSIDSIGRIGLKELLDNGEEKESDDGEGEEEEEGFIVDEEDDIMKLRKEILKERKLRAAAELELEKERTAALSAADEAMAKILWLQNEKGLIEREARQYRAMAEQKQRCDQEVIESLQWMILRLEAERRDLESPLEVSMIGNEAIENTVIMGIVD